MTPLPLTLRLFGPLRILVHGKPLPRLRTRSLEWLLAMLVLRHGRAVDRAWLSGTLWTESEAGQALKNLRNNLSCLRAALGAEAWRIQSPSRDTLTLDLDGADVDLVRFDRGIQAGDEESLRASVGAYAGPLLEGCYEEWVHPERGSRAAQCLQALERLAEAAQERGNHPEAIAYLQRAELLDPLRDSTARRLIASLDACGNPAAALEVYRRLRNRLHDEMSVAPDPDTTLLFQQIRARARRRPRDQEVRCPDAPAANHPSFQTPILPPSSPAPRRPPYPLTRLIGREQVVREVGEQIAASRLVTLVGAGGVGKTRLAIEVSHAIADDFIHGAAFVELASLSDPALLPAFLAAALGLREEESSREAEALLTVLAGWLSAHNVLLVLDNCEQLIEAIATLAHALLERCANLRILATSRQRLGVTGEVVCRVPSLPAPDPEQQLPGDLDLVEHVQQYGAVQLFLERAAMTHPGFRLAGPTEARAVAQICRRLDGIPLAIELAAARVGSLSVAQIAARLDDRFRLLAGGSRAALPRHQTLRALIDWSYDQLEEDERAVLRRLSVFVGGWTLEAAEAVCGGSMGVWVYGCMGVGEPVSTPTHPYTHTPTHQDEVLDLLTALVDKSLVVFEEREAGTRYRMLETVREYAAEKLRERGEEEAARNQHLAYCQQLAKAVAGDLRDVDPEEALAHVAIEIGNLRAALGWTQTERAPPDASLQLTAAIWPYWEMRGHHAEGREHLHAALNRPGCPADTPERAEALLGAASLAFVQAELETTLDTGRQSLALFRSQNNPRGAAAALILCGHAALESDALLEAASLLEEALEYCRRCHWERGRALALTHLGLLAMRQGAGEQARSHLEEGLRVAEAVGHPLTLALSLHNRGYLALETGDYASAVTLLEKSLAIWRRLGHGHKASLTLRNLGLAARRQGNPKAALSYFEKAVIACREQGNRFHLAFMVIEAGSVHYQQQDYEAARRAYEEGLELFVQCGNQWGVNAAGMNLGCALFHLGDYRRARDLHRSALDHYHTTANLDGIVWSMERLAVTEARDADAMRAARLLGAAAKMRGALGRRMDLWDQTDWDGAVAAARLTLGDAGYGTASAEGGAMTLDQAVSYALSRLSAIPTR